MTHNPELVDATDLHQWASRREAQALLPQLIRKLLSATPGVIGVSIRAGEGIGVPGWDGRADGGAGTSYIPARPSQWEMGTGDDPRDKAQSDYRKRTDDPGGVTPPTTAFVFVTLRRWGAKDHKDDKEAWVQEKRGENKWREVVALDADDLEGWLETVPAVHVWLSERMGRSPLEVQTLDRWWESWSAQTDPTLPAELLLAGRHKEARKLREILQGPVDAIGLHSSSRDEAIAFLAASLIVPDQQTDWPLGDGPLAVVLVVSSLIAWKRLASSPSPAILVPDFEGADVASAVRGGHHVLVPMGSSDDEGRARLALPWLSRDEARDALQAAGWSSEKADRHAVQARRSLQSLRRMLAVNPRFERPAWACPPAAYPFASLMLVGSWLADSAPDQEIVAAAASQQYTPLQRVLKQWAASDDPPFVLSGQCWQLASPLDAWALLRSVLTRDDLARWCCAATRVLAETDPALGLPPAERPFAAIRGATRVWSGDLRRGLARGAALLGVVGDEVLADGWTGPDHAALFVRDLLAQANSDSTGHIWQSLADVLPLLAEAAPEQFLEAVETALSGDPPLLRLMFTDSDNTTAWSVSSPHTGLLWALETLCWPTQYLSLAVDALARLAEIDPGGRLGNRPSASLRSVLLPWLPRTSAPLGRRLAVVAGLVARRPTVGWRLLLALLPTEHDVSFPTVTPLFRDWKPPKDEVPLAEYLEAVHELVGQALAAATQQPARWTELLVRLQGLPAEELNRSLDALEGTAIDVLDPGCRVALWSAVTELVAEHRQFSTAEWALPKEPLKRLEAFAARIEPDDAAAIFGRLFDWDPDLPGTDKFDQESYSKALYDARRTSIQKVLESGGVDALGRLAEKSKVPRFVGWLAADVAGDHLGEQLLPWLSADEPHRDVTVGFVMRMFETHEWGWVETANGKVAALPEGARTTFYLSLPMEPRTWALVDADTESVQNQYWQSVVVPAVAVENVAPFAERLLERHRPWFAIYVLALHCRGVAAATRPPMGLIQRALLTALDPDIAETGRPAGMHHRVGALFDYLEASGAAPDTMCGLEWAYLPLLDRIRKPRALHGRLASDPRAFVEAVCGAFRGRHQARADANVDPAASLRAHNYYTLLQGWRHPPGTDAGGSVSDCVLRAWTDDARRLLAEEDRAEIGDELIGQLFSGSAAGEDGIWPAEAIRDMIEDLKSGPLETGLSIGKRASRGFTSRGAYDGGQQEISLSEQFRSWAEQVEGRWPRSGRVLRNIAGAYRREAHREDESAEKLADED